jgi:hypothetical protein
MSPRIRTNTTATGIAPDKLTSQRNCLRACKLPNRSSSWHVRQQMIEGARVRAFHELADATISDAASAELEARPVLGNRLRIFGIRSWNKIEAPRDPSRRMQQQLWR